MRFKLFGICFEISYTIVCLIGICIVAGMFEGFLWGALAIVIHELGHIIAMRFCGYFPERIKISPFEINISDPGRGERNTRQNIFVIILGPLANFICFLAGFLLYLEGSTALLPLMLANLSAGLFNLLPVMTLDGGQLVYLLLSRRLDQKRAERTVHIFTLAAIIPLAALGILVLWKTGYNFSLLFVCAYLILALISRDNRYF